MQMSQPAVLPLQQNMMPCRLLLFRTLPRITVAAGHQTRLALGKTRLEAFPGMERGFLHVSNNHKAAVNVLRDFLTASSRHGIRGPPGQASVRPTKRVAI